MKKKLLGQLGTYDLYSRSVKIVASTINKVDGEALTKWDLSRFEKNPVVLWSHDTNRLPIGLAYDVCFDAELGLTMTVKFGSEAANPLAEQIAKCVEEGLVRAVSVGYTIEKGVAVLDEVSFVAIGADEDAGTPHINVEHEINAEVVRSADEEDEDEDEEDEDEEDEESWRAKASDAARVLRYHRARISRLLAYGVPRTDALVSFDEGFRSDSMTPGSWYHQNAGGDIWFRATEELKNGGMAGVQVDWSKKNPVAKKSSVPRGFDRLWKPTSDVPSEVHAVGVAHPAAMSTAEKAAIRDRAIAQNAEYLAKPSVEAAPKAKLEPATGDKLSKAMAEVASGRGRGHYTPKEHAARPKLSDNGGKPISLTTDDGVRSPPMGRWVDPYKPAPKGGTHGTPKEKTSESTGGGNPGDQPRDESGRWTSDGLRTNGPEYALTIPSPLASEPPFSAKEAATKVWGLVTQSPQHFSEKAERLSAKAEQATLEADRAREFAREKATAFDRDGEFSPFVIPSGTEFGNDPPIRNDVPAAYKAAAEAAEAAAKAQRLASQAHRVAYEKNPDKAMHAQKAEAHAGLSQAHKDTAKAARASVSRNSAKVPEAPSGMSAASFLQGLNDGGVTTSGSREEQSRGPDGRWDAADEQHRFDTSRLGKVERTQLGGAKIAARLSRTGVLIYRNPDGSQRRELRLPEEIFKADSLATLEHAPVIDIKDHTGMVTPETWRRVSLGHVAGVRQEGHFIVSDLLIQDQATLDAIDNGSRTEISCGYRCVLDMTPGVYKGEAYDCVQRNIRYNHAALCPPNRGRAGPEVGLRLDSNVAPVWSETHLDEEPQEHSMTVKIKLDGREYEFGSEAHVAKIEDLSKTAITNLRLDAKTLSEQLVAATKRADKAQAECDAAKEALTKFRADAEVAVVEGEKQAVEKESFARQAKRFRRSLERKALRFFSDQAPGEDEGGHMPVAKAAPAAAPTAEGADAPAPPAAKDEEGAVRTREFAPGTKAPPFKKEGEPDGDEEEKTDALESRLDDMSDRDVMLHCLVRNNPRFDAKDKSDDYVAARFDAMIEDLKQERGVNGVVKAVRKITQHLDATDNANDPVSKARAERDRAMSNAWIPKTV